MFSKNKTQSADASKTTPVASAAETSGADQPEKAAASDSPQPAAEGKETAPASSDATGAKPSPEAAELAVMKDRYMRLMADFDNFRKRQVREREEWINRANGELLGDLIPVADHLELALAKADVSDDPFVKGVKMVHDQLIALFDRYGMTPIDAKGKPFDPAFHEALSQMSSATVPAQVVIDQFRRGWMLAGRLLRPAQVIVSSGAPDQAQAESENESVAD